MSRAIHESPHHRLQPLRVHRSDVGVRRARRPGCHDPGGSITADDALLTRPGWSISPGSLATPPRRQSKAEHSRRMS